jgi:hypothetical protein
MFFTILFNTREYRVSIELVATVFEELSESLSVLISRKVVQVSMTPGLSSTKL